MIAKLEAGASAWTRRLALAGGWLLLLMSAVTVADALLRKLFSRPIQGTFEASELALGAIIFLAMPYTGLTDGHVVLDLFTNRFSPRTQAVIVALNALFVAAFLALVAWQLGVLTGDYGRTARTTITMRIPVSPVALCVTVAAWLAALASVIQALAAFARATSPPA